MDFEEYSRAQLPGLVRFAAALTGDTELAQDLVHDALIRAYARVVTSVQGGPARSLPASGGDERVPVLAATLVSANGRIGREYDCPLTLCPPGRTPSARPKGACSWGCEPALRRIRGP